MFEALKFEALVTVTSTVTCRSYRDLYRDYTIKLNLAGGAGGHRPERRGGEFKKHFVFLVFLT